ncbi:MAG: large repetitive protein, partial [Actinomycetota bacterium]
MRRGPIARAIVATGMLALVFTYVVPPLQSFRLPARDNRAALPSFNVPAFDFPRLNPPKAAKASTQSKPASPFALSTNRLANANGKKVRRAVAGKRRKVRLPVSSNIYVTRPQPKKLASTTATPKDPFANAPIVDNTVGAIPSAPPAPTTTQPAAPAPTDTTAPTDTAAVADPSIPPLDTREPTPIDREHATPDDIDLAILNAEATATDTTAPAPTPAIEPQTNPAPPEQPLTIGPGVDAPTSSAPADGPMIAPPAPGAITPTPPAPIDAPAPVTPPAETVPPATTTDTTLTLTTTSSDPTGATGTITSTSTGDATLITSGGTTDTGSPVGSVTQNGTNDGTSIGSGSSSAGGVAITSGSSGTQGPPPPSTGSGSGSSAPVDTGLTSPTSASTSATDPASDPGSPRGPPPAVTQEQLNAAFVTAKATWLAVEPNADFSGVTVRTADLPDLELGHHDGRTITIDTDAAGWGWSVSYPGDTTGRHMDLTTVVLHELGHMLGLDHGTGLMDPTLQASQIESPTSTDVTLGASPDDDALTAASAAQNIHDVLQTDLTSPALGTH